MSVGEKPLLAGVIGLNVILHFHNSKTQTAWPGAIIELGMMTLEIESM